MEAKKEPTGEDLAARLWDGDDYGDTHATALAHFAASVWREAMYAASVAPSQAPSSKALSADLHAAIMGALEHHHMQFTHSSEDEHMPLADMLTPDGDDTVKRGLQEIELLADAVFNEVEPLLLSVAPVTGMEATSGELAGLPQEVDREAPSVPGQRCIHGITGECPQCKAMADRLKERRDQACADYGKGRARLANVPLTGDSGAPDANPDGIQPGQDSPVRMNPGTGAWDAPNAEVATPALVEASQEGKTPSPSPEGKQQGDA